MTYTEGNYRDLMHDEKLQKKLIAVSDFLREFPAFHMHEFKQLDVFDGSYIIPIGFLALSMFTKKITYTKSFITRQIFERSIKRINFGMTSDWANAYRSPFSPMLLSIIDNNQNIILLDGFARANHMFKKGQHFIETLSVDINDYDALTNSSDLFPKKIYRTNIEQKRLLEVSRDPIKLSSINSIEGRFFVTPGKNGPLIERKIPAVGTEKVLRLLRAKIALELHSRAENISKKQVHMKGYIDTIKDHYKISYEIDGSLTHETARKQENNSKFAPNNKYTYHADMIFDYIKEKYKEDDKSLFYLFNAISAACEFLHSCQKSENHYKSDIFREKRNANLIDECLLREKLSRLAPEGLGLLSVIVSLAKDTGINIAHIDEFDTVFLNSTFRELVECYAVTHRLKRGIAHAEIDVFTALNFLSRLGYMITIFVERSAKLQEHYSESDVQWLALSTYAMNLSLKTEEKESIDDRLISLCFRSCSSIFAVEGMFSDNSDFYYPDIQD